MIIGLTGTKGSGKGVVADILKSMGFQYVSLSDIVRVEAKKKYGSPTATQMMETGNRLRKAHGPGVLAEKVTEKIGNGNWVVDGIRNPAEVKVLRNMNGFRLISVDADRKIRYERVRSRDRHDRPASFEEFEMIDARDLGKDEPLTGQRVKDTMKMADIKIQNNGSLHTLRGEIEDALLELLRL